MQTLSALTRHFGTLAVLCTQVAAASAPAQGTDTALVITLGPRPPASDTVALQAWLRVTGALGERARVTVPNLTAVRESVKTAWKTVAPAGLSTAFAFDSALARSQVNLVARLYCAGCVGRRVQAEVYELPRAVAAPRETGAGGTYALTESELKDLSPALETLTRRRRMRGSEVVVRAAEFGERPLTDADRFGDGFNQVYSQVLPILRRAQPARRTILAILDSGWPTSIDKAVSMRLLDSLETLARAVYGIASDGEVPERVSWARPNYPHVLSVHAAMDPLARLNAPSLSVLYVPLVWPAGDSARLRRLLGTAQKIQRKLDVLLDPDGPTCDVQRLKVCFNEPGNRFPVDARDTAGVGRLVSLLTADTVQHAFSEGVRTTTDIYNAVWLLLHTWSEENAGTAAFINASWIAPFAYILMPPQPVFNGAPVITVAAAGNNDIALTSATAHANFIARPYQTDHQFVIVENRRLNGDPMCSSTRLDEVPESNHEMLTSHFGLIMSFGTCGSSFATPRVAWVLATAETLRSAGCKPIDEGARRVRAERAAGAQRWRWPAVYLGMVSAIAPVDNDPCRTNTLP